MREIVNEIISNIRWNTYMICDSTRFFVNKRYSREVLKVYFRSNYGLIDIVDDPQHKEMSKEISNYIDTYCKEKDLKLLRLFPNDFENIETLVIKFIVNDMWVKDDTVKLNIAKLIIRKMKNNAPQKEIDELEDLIK